MVSLIVVVLYTILLLCFFTNLIVMVHATMVHLVVHWLQIETRVIVVMVVSPAWFLFDVGDMASCPLTAVDDWMFQGDISAMVAELMCFSQVSLMLILHCLLMSIFFLESAAQVLLEFLLLGDVALMRLQVGERLMELAHEDLVVGLAEVSVVVASELVVAVYHVSDRAHHPLDGVHRADAVRVAVHHCDGCLADVLDGNVCRHAVLLPLKVGVGVLLEAPLDTVLEEVGEGTSGHWLLAPVDLLVAPLSSEMRADFRLELLPVEPVQAIKPDHVDLVDQVAIVVITHGATKDVHLGAWGEQDGSTQVVLVEALLHVGKTVEDLRRALIVPNVHNLVCVADVRILHILLDRILDRLEHGRHILGTHLGERPIPKLLRVVLMMMVRMAQTVISSSVITKPDVVAGLIELDGHGFAKLRRWEPGVSRHAKSRHDQHRLGCSTMHRVVSNGTGQTEHGQNVAIVCRRGERLPIVLELIERLRKAWEAVVVLLTGCLHGRDPDHGNRCEFHHNVSSIKKIL